MKKIFIIYIFMHLIFSLSVTSAQPLNAFNPQMVYLCAGASTAAYSDKSAMLARDILAKKDFTLEHYVEDNYTHEVKFLLATKNLADKKLYLLAISGTDSLQDVKTDIEVTRCLFSGNTPDEFVQSMQIKDLDESTPLTHSGFTQYVQDGFFTKKINDLTFGEYLASKLDNNTDELYITGHSLGGAVAQLLAVRLMNMGIDSHKIHIITFGAPATANQAFIDKYEQHMDLNRITISGDIVKNLAQIANTKLVQFKNNTVWKIPLYESDKSPHSVLLYFDRAMHNYFDQINSNLNDSYIVPNHPNIYVLFKFNFPLEIQAEEFYIKSAIIEKLKTEYPDKNIAIVNNGDITLEDNSQFIVYNFEGSILQNSNSNKRYYIYGSKIIYDEYKNLLSANGSSIDTNTLTVFQASLYTVEKPQGTNS